MPSAMPLPSPAMAATSASAIAPVDLQPGELDNVRSAGREGGWLLLLLVACCSRLPGVACCAARRRPTSSRELNGRSHLARSLPAPSSFLSCASWQSGVAERPVVWAACVDCTMRGETGGQGRDASSSSPAAARRDFG